MVTMTTTYHRDKYSHVGEQKLEPGNWWWMKSR